LADYQFMLNHAKRVIFDTSIVSPEAMDYPWPRPEAIRDLVYARLLPVRQSLGQFLSGFTPQKLVGGLKEVRLYHKSKYGPEARVLLAWLRERLAQCGAASDLAGAVKASEAAGIDDFAVEFRYDGDGCFKWRADIAKNRAEFP